MHPAFTGWSLKIYFLPTASILCSMVLRWWKNTSLEFPGTSLSGRTWATKKTNLTRLAKEFVKFNERCFVRLLGDMRSYNFVIDTMADFDDTQYRFRAIDFDQQSYEGKKNLYLPQFFKENNPFVNLCITIMNEETVKQYQLEERSLMSRRFRTARYRIACLLETMINDSISPKEKIEQLREELSAHYERNEFMRCRNMGEIMRLSLDLLLESPERNLHLGHLA